MLGETDGAAQDPRVGGGESRRPRPGDPGAGPGVGGEEDHAGRGRTRRHGRRLPGRHRQRVGPGHGRSGGHAGSGQAGQQHLGDHQGAPLDCSFVFPGYAEGGISGDPGNTAAGFRLAYRMFPKGGALTNPHHSTEGQTVPRLRIPEAMLHEHLEWRGKGFCGSPIESQFKKYEYPAPGYPQSPCTTATAAPSSAP